MSTGLGGVLLRVTAKPRRPSDPPPLLVELLRKQLGGVAWSGEAYPFAFRVTSRESASFYEVSCTLPAETIAILRGAVDAISSGLDPREVEPLTFERLIEVLSQHAAEELGERGLKARVKEAAELAAFEAIGLSRILALAKDEKVTEFFADSDMTPIYLDHSEAGRCETSIVLTERERTALETHLDTFSGYTLDFKTPSMKNDMKMAGALLRVSLDLEPISVNRFALDVRRLNVSSLSLERLVALGVISDEAAAFLVAWIELGGNVTIVGETGTGKTTLLNALDEQVERTLRRLYIEDAVETRDLLGKGYHQMKVKVDPFERGDDSGRTKEQEIVKALHRSPDIVVLSEIQSEEHSHAFFHALAAGARGMQTFHASSIEQAIRRWVNMHHIPEQCLFDLGVMVQMSRPDRLKQKRVVQRLCAVVQEGGAPRAKELYLRDRQSRLCNVAGGTWPRAPEGVEMAKFEAVAVAALRRLRGQ